MSEHCLFRIENDVVSENTLLKVTHNRNIVTGYGDVKTLTKDEIVIILRADRTGLVFLAPAGLFDWKVLQFGYKSINSELSYTFCRVENVP